MCKTKDDLIKKLENYKVNYYRWLYLNTKTDVKSPIFNNDCKGYVPAKDIQLNNMIEEKREIELEMQEVETMLERLRDEDLLAFNILHMKYIEFLSLEEIAHVQGYSLSHIKQNLLAKSIEGLYKSVLLCAE